MSDLSDFAHATGFYVASVFISFFAAMAQDCLEASQATLAIYAFGYAAIVCLALSLALFALGSINIVLGFKNLRKGR